MNVASINSQINGEIISALSNAAQYFMLLVQSAYFIVPVALLIGAYLLHLTKGLVKAKTLPHSTVHKSSPIAWTVPVLLVSLVIVKVISVLR